MKRSFLIGSMILVLAFSLCACGGDKAAGIPSRETRRLTGTYSWQDVECILFDKDNTFEIYANREDYKSWNALTIEDYDIIQCVIKRVCAENHITPLQFDFIYW